MPTINESKQHIPKIESQHSNFSDADDEAEHGNVTVPRTNTAGRWQWQKH